MPLIRTAVQWTLPARADIRSLLNSPRLSPPVESRMIWLSLECASLRMVQWKWNGSGEMREVNELYLRLNTLKDRFGIGPLIKNHSEGEVTQRDRVRSKESLAILPYSCSSRTELPEITWTSLSIEVFFSWLLAKKKKLLIAIKHTFRAVFFAQEKVFFIYCFVYERDGKIWTMQSPQKWANIKCFNNYPQNKLRLPQEARKSVPHFSGALGPADREENGKEWLWPVEDTAGGLRSELAYLNRIDGLPDVDPAHTTSLSLRHNTPLHFSTHPFNCVTRREPWPTPQALGEPADVAGAQYGLRQGSSRRDSEDG